MEWLDTTKDSLNKLMAQRPSPARTKEIIDEIKVSVSFFSLDINYRVVSPCASCSVKL